MKTSRVDDEAKHHSKTKIRTRAVHGATGASSLAIGPANREEEKKKTNKQTEDIDKKYVRNI
jgi:hypothetical protein